MEGGPKERRQPPPLESEQNLIRIRLPVRVVVPSLPAIRVTPPPQDGGSGQTVGEKDACPTAQAASVAVALPPPALGLSLMTPLKYCLCKYPDKKFCLRTSLSISSPHERFGVCIKT